MDEEIKLIQAKVNDIISRPSSWFFNWGIIVTFSTLALLVLVSFVIPYREQLSCKVIFNTRHELYAVKSPATGIIKNLTLNPKDKIKNGRQLLMIQESPSGKMVPLIAAVSGYYSRSKNELQVNDRVHQYEILFNIAPDITDDNELYAVGYLDKFEISKLTIGNPVSLTIEEYNKQIEISGYISSISNYPAPSHRKYPFYITLNKNDIAYLQKSKAFYFNMNADARINYKNQKIARKVFDFLY